MTRSPSCSVAMGLLVVVGSALLSSVGAGAFAAPAGDAPIRLRAATFHPQRGEAPAVPSDLRANPAQPGAAGYYIVQFTGPVLAEWRQRLAGTGAEALGYIPEFAFKTRMTPEQAATVADLPEVAWVGPFHPAYRIAPGALESGPGLFRVRIETGTDGAAAVASVLRSGAMPLKVDDRVLVVHASPAQLKAIARVLDVAWIERYAIPETHNEQGGGVIIGGSIALGRGFDGSTQVVAVADTGIGNGTASGAHADIPAGRIVAIHDWPGDDYPPCYNTVPDGPVDVDSGHGTHTAVSAVGDGGLGGTGMGVAPAADLVFQATEDFIDVHHLCSDPDGYYLIGLPLDLHYLYQQAYDDGARIHSNSWGSDVAGDYTVDSADTDDFVFDHPTFTVTFSAGNAGVDEAPANGVVDSGSVGSPATAKNVIAVGASEGARPDAFPCDTGLAYASYDPYQTGTCTAQGGHNTLGFGSRWGFTVSPLSNDLSAGNAQQMAPFSSRGPTTDGRIKPDVVAPGTWILSGYSNMYQEGYGGAVNPANGLYQWDGWGLPFNQYYKYMGGTSMSNPLAAGSAAVVADFYVKTAAHVPSAALVKATLVNTARDLLDENNDGANDNDFPIPNQHEGWGIIDLANATDGSHRYVDNTAGLQTAGSAVFQYEVAAGGSPLRVTLAWSDAPSTEAAAMNLVNDLDLVVVAPNGTTTYPGNVFAGGWSSPSASYDRVNNLENVYVSTAAAGIWTMTVQGYNVPAGPQPFALVVDGDLADVADTTPPVITGTPDDTTVEATSAAGATVSYTTPTATDLVDGPVIVTCLPPSGSAFPLGATTVTCTASDAAGNDASTQFNVTVQDTTPPVISNVPLDQTVAATGPGGATVSYAAPTANDLVDGPVTVTCLPPSGSTFPIGTTTVTCTATDTASNQGTADFDITVQEAGGEDTTPPVISNVPDDMTVAATGPGGATVAYTSPTANDVVDGPVPVDCLPTSGSAFPIGLSTVTCTATDTASNEATADFTISVVDASGVVRYSGATRYETAAAISAGDFPDPDAVEVVFVAYGGNFPDALAGAAVAGRLGAPLLLVQSDSIPTAVATELTRLDPNTIVILGGTSVISPGVEIALGAYAPTVIRLAGGDRYATAVEVSEYGFPSPGSADTVIVVTGQGFADALAGGPAAVALNGPVLLTNPTSLPAVVAAEITRLAPGRIVVIGGTAAVSEAVFDQLEPLAAEVVRIAGASRYQTAIAVSVEAFASSHRGYVATGLNFPDALAGGAAAGWWGGPMLLVPGTSLPDEVGTEIGRLGATKVIILGGTGGVSQGVEDTLNAFIAG